MLALIDSEAVLEAVCVAVPVIDALGVTLAVMDSVCVPVLLVELV